MIPVVNTKVSVSLMRRWSVAFFAAFLLLSSTEGLAADPEPVPDLKQGTPATYTSLRQFPQNLKGNLFALFSKDNIAPLLIGGAATGIIAPFDDGIRDRWSLRGRSTAIGDIGSIIGGSAVVIPSVAGLLIAGQKSKNDRFHSFTYSLAQAAVINIGIAEGLKISVRRNRPDESDKDSFPSAHAANSFMIATVVQHYYGRTAGLLGYSAATFIAFSRIREDKHWASDLTAGATIGYIVGSSVCRRTGISLRVGKITLIPAFDPGHRRIGVSIIPNSE